MAAARGPLPPAPWRSSASSGGNKAHPPPGEAYTYDPPPTPMPLPPLVQEKLKAWKEARAKEAAEAEAAEAEHLSPERA